MLFLSVVLSSDDEEEEEIGSTNRIESISPRPADSACSSPAPSTGKVEAALKENTCELEQRLTSITADTEPAVILPRKSRMKDQVVHPYVVWNDRLSAYTILIDKCEHMVVNTCKYSAVFLWENNLLLSETKHDVIVFISLSLLDCLNIFKCYFTNLDHNLEMCVANSINPARRLKTLDPTDCVTSCFWNLEDLEAGWIEKVAFKKQGGEEAHWAQAGPYASLKVFPVLGLCFNHVRTSFLWLLFTLFW